MQSGGQSSKHFSEVGSHLSWTPTFLCICRQNVTVFVDNSMQPIRPESVVNTIRSFLSAIWKEINTLSLESAIRFVPR